MALTWNVSKVENHEVVTTDPNDPNKWHPLTEALIWATMFIGMYEITKKNHEEFYARVFVQERVGGTYRMSLQKDGVRPVPLYTTLEEVKSHIGLYTNVSMKTLAQFWKGIKKEALEYNNLPVMKSDLSWVLIQKHGERMVELFNEYGASDLAKAIEHLLDPEHVEDKDD